MNHWLMAVIYAISVISLAALFTGSICGFRGLFKETWKWFLGMFVVFVLVMGPEKNPVPFPGSHAAETKEGE